MADPELIRQGEQSDRAVLAFVKRYIKTHGYPPTLREIAAGKGGPNTANGVRASLQRLEGKGKVKVSGASRGIVVIDNKGK